MSEHALRRHTVYGTSGAALVVDASATQPMLSVLGGPGLPPLDFRLDAADVETITEVLAPDADDVEEAVLTRIREQQRERFVAEELLEGTDFEVVSAKFEDSVERAADALAELLHGAQPNVLREIIESIIEGSDLSLAVYDAKTSTVTLKI